MYISKRTFILIPGFMALGIVITALLAWRALAPLKNSEKFSRKFLNTVVKENGVLGNGELMGLAGSTATHLFFQMKDPSKVLMTDYHLKDADTINIGIPKNERTETAFSTYVDSPYVSVMAGRLSAVFEKQIFSDSLSIYRLPTTLFTRGIKVGPKVYVVRGVDTVVKRFDQILLKANSLTGSIKLETNISETNKDAGLSTDGMLTFNKKHNLVFYSQYYSKKIVCVDSNMNLKYSMNTIDNTRYFPIKSTINKNVLTAETPKRLVNAYCSTSGDKLYVYSAVKAENEDEGDHKNNSSIDEYNVNTGEYIGSFYVPVCRNEKVKRFAVVNNALVALYKSNVVIYQLGQQVE